MVCRIARGYEHGRLYAVDGRGHRRRRLVSFMDHCRGVGDQKHEGAPFISVITTELIELLVGYSIAKGIGADFSTIDRVM